MFCSSAVRAGLTLPVVEYSHGDGCSVTGGFRYRGDRFPELDGAYIFGDYCCGKIWAAAPNAGTRTMVEVASTSHLIVSFGEDTAGELYGVDHLGSVMQLTVDRPKRRAVRR